MLVIQDDDVRVILNPNVDLLKGFFQDIEPEFKLSLARKQDNASLTDQTNWYISIQSPINSEDINSKSKEFEQILSQRLIIKNGANSFICFLLTVFAILFASKYPILNHALTMIVITALGMTLHHYLSVKTTTWYKTQLDAIACVKQYIYLSFNAVCVEDIQKSIDIIKQQSELLNKLNYDVTVTKEANSIINLRYTDLIKRVPNKILQSHKSFCKIKIPTPLEYEEQTTQLVH